MTAPDPQPLHVGDSGAAVAELQYRLRVLRLYDGDLDGYLGDRTAQAVALLRAHAGVPGDGPVDVATWELLDQLERTAGLRDPFVEPGEGGGTGGDTGTGTGTGTGTVSDRGQWRWDGRRWQPADEIDVAALAGSPTGAVESAEEHWEWDGERWRYA